MLDSNVIRPKRVQQRQNPWFGFGIGIYTTYLVVYTFFLLGLMNNVQSVIESYSVWEVGGVFTKSYEFYLWNLGSTLLGISSVYFVFKKKWFGFVASILALLGMIISFAVFYSKLKFYNAINDGMLLFSGVLPAIFIIIFSVMFIQLSLKKGEDKLLDF